MKAKKADTNFLRPWTLHVVQTGQESCSFQVHGFLNNLASQTESDSK